MAWNDDLSGSALRIAAATTSPQIVPVIAPVRAVNADHHTTMRIRTR
jgi:hypothetical protein